MPLGSWCGAKALLVGALAAGESKTALRARNAASVRRAFMGGSFGVDTRHCAPGAKHRGHGHVTVLQQLEPS
jgi:hypothetical protein